MHCPFGVLWPSRRQMLKRVIGFERFIVLYSWRCGFIFINRMDRKSLSSSSTTSRRPSSLRVVSNVPQYSPILDLVCSLHLLEDLCVACHGGGNGDYDGTALKPLTSPPLSGTLELYLPHGAERIVRPLLDLPNGLHFRKLAWTWHLEEAVRWMTALVVPCSDAL